MPENTCKTCAFFGKDAWNKPACTHDEVSTFCDCMGNSVGRPDFGCINHQMSIVTSCTEITRCCSTRAHWGLDDPFCDDEGDETCGCQEVISRIATDDSYVPAEFHSSPDFSCSHWEERKKSPYILPPNAVILYPTDLFDTIELKWVEDREFVKIGPYEVVFGATVRIDATDIPVVDYPGIEAPLLLADHTEVEYTETKAPDVGPTIDSIIVDVEINFGGFNACPMAESMFPLRTNEEAS